MEKGDLQKFSADLDAIKKLMVLSLVQKGLKQGDVAAVLGIDDATLSRMFPKGLLKKVKGRSADE
jgi:hypothetical protein